MSDDRPDSCSHCTKQCSIHLTQVINGKVCKVSMCKDCPKAAQVQEGTGYDLFDAIGQPQLKHSIGPVDGTKCPRCGFSQEDFKDRGRLGCDHCYDVFGDRLLPILANIHRGGSHLGKIPKRFQSAASERQVSDLKRRLEELIVREEYEEAAVLRDRIKELEIG